MNRVLWGQVREIVECALSLPADERPAYVARASSGTTARQAAVTLIASYEQAESFLEQPASDLIEMETEEPECLIGRRIGAYEITSELGHGGMGAVYKAKRADGQFEQEVAIKLITRNLHSAFTIGRFKAERQILATLDHPNIAKLLDGGTAEDGLPYLVMELVHGTPIDEYAEEHHFSLEEKLMLFQTVCSAVHHAHTHLIVHRDIKPSNILVTGEGIPKLLDFGIAKLLDPAALAGTGDQTIPLVRLLTPEYGSPEQVRGETITTASDVYSLGVVLFKLLTGRLPYTIGQNTFEAVSSAVCEIEPPKPSSIGLTDRRNSKGDVNRSVEKRSKQLRGDLDNIVLMALRKEPERRYRSVEQLAEDIRRHLENLPVVARQDTIGYRTSKFVARHRSSVAAFIAIFLILVVGLAVTTHEVQVVRRERSLAEQRFNDVRELAGSLIFDIHDSIRDLPGATVARKILLDRAVKYLDNLSAQASDRPDLQRELAAAYERVGDVQGNPRYANLGDTAAAIASYRKALRLRATLANDGRGNFRDGVALTAIYGKLAFGLGATNNFPAELEALRSAYPIAEKLAAEQEGNPDAQEAFAATSFAMAQCLGDMGDLAGALEYYRKSARIREGITASSPGPQVQMQINVAGVYDYMSEALYLNGDLDSALSSLIKAHDIIARLGQSNPNDATVRQFLLQEEYGIGYYLAEKRLPQQALAHYRIALAGYQKLSLLDSHDVVVLRYLSKCYMGIGRALAAEGRPEEGIQFARKAIRSLEALSNADRVDTYYKAPDLAYARSALGEICARLAVQPAMSDSSKIARWREARFWYQKSLETWLLLQRTAPLARWDAAQPGKIANEVTKCDHALKELQAKP